MKTWTPNFTSIDTLVEPYRKRAVETDVQALGRILEARAHKGWELVDICGDEFRTQCLILKRMPAMHEKPEYRIEQLQLDPTKQELLSIMDYFRVRQSEGWRPVCIMEAPSKAPVVVLARTHEAILGATIKAAPLSLKAFGKRAISVVDEICELQLSLGLMPVCVLHGGLNPVLIMVAKPKNDMYEYLVDHAFGGFYKNQTTTLHDLIQSRSEEGWQVCGTFEDVFLWPCVIFNRKTHQSARQLNIG